MILVGLLVVAVALRMIDAFRVPTPWIMPDEFLYAELGRGLYEHGSLAVLGRDVPFYSLVHPLLIGLPLSLAGPEVGYRIAQTLQVLAMTSVAIPTYAWSRRLVAPTWALLAAALALALPALAYAGLLVTEASFYPAFVLASWASARAIARPTLGAQAFAVGSILIAAAIRLQALALVPAFATAVLLAALMEGSRSRARRLTPAVVSLLLGTAAWCIVQVARTGEASAVLGGYAAAADSSYSFSSAALYVVYHLGDVLLLTAVVPACAVASLAFAAFAGREPDRDVVAYLAVTLSFVAWTAVAVGVFASQHVHHLAERNLFHVAPLLFVGLALWLARAAPRSVWIATGIVAGALLLLVVLPVQRFTELGALHNEPTLVPLYELVVRFPRTDLDLLVPSVGLGLLAFFAFGSRTSLVVLAVLLVPVGIVASVFTSSFVVEEARGLERDTFDGPAHRWVDEIALGPVAYVYGEARFYPGVLQTAFWNRRVTALYELPRATIPDVPRTIVRPLSVATDSGVIGGLRDFDYALAPNTVTLVGTELDRRGGLTLTRLQHPARIARRLDGFHADGTIAGKAALRVYACRGGTLQLDVTASVRPARILVTRNGVPHLRLNVPARGDRHLEIPVAMPEGAAAGTASCTVGFDVREAVTTRRVRFRAPR